jgi:cell wall integrity and stress response component
LKSDVPAHPQSTTTSNASNTQPTASATGDNESNRTAEKTQSTSKTGAIAGGVVGGVCGAVAIIGGVIFFWQYKKRNAGVNGAKTTPMSECRFDGDYIPQRHQSNGSIDDHREFFCRGLHVNVPPVTFNCISI